MPLSKQEQARILKQDAERRAARFLLEQATLGMDMLDNAMSDAYKIAHAPKDSHVNPCLVRSIGVVCPPPKTSASQDNWARGMKGTTRGVANVAKPVPNTVRVIHNGITTDIPVSQLRGTTKRSRKTSTEQRKPETARIELKGMDWSQ